MKFNFVKMIVTIFAALFVVACQNVPTTSNVQQQNNENHGLADYKKFRYWEEVSTSRLDYIQAVADQAMEKNDTYQYLQAMTWFNQELHKSKTLLKDLDMSNREVLKLKELAIEVLDVSGEIVSDSIKSLLQYNDQTAAQEDMQKRADVLSEKAVKLDSLNRELGEKFGYKE